MLTLFSNKVESDKQLVACSRSAGGPVFKECNPFFGSVMCFFFAKSVELRERASVGSEQSL